MHANAIKTDGRMGGLAKIERGTLQRQKREGLCTRFKVHGLNPLGSMSLETHKKLVSAYCMCTPTTHTERTKL